jgi:hypothetical protein
MLTGKQPEAGDTRVGPSVPPDLQDVVSKALDPRPGGGYEAAATCAAELRSVAAMLDVREASAEPARVVPVRRGKSPRAWIVVAIAVVVAVFAALAALWRW